MQPRKARERAISVERLIKGACGDFFFIPCGSGCGIACDPIFKFLKSKELGACTMALEFCQVLAERKLGIFLGNLIQHEVFETIAIRRLKS